MSIKDNYFGKGSVGVLFYAARSVVFNLVTISATLQLNTSAGFAQLVMPDPWACCGGAEN